MVLYKLSGGKNSFRKLPGKEKGKKKCSVYAVVSFESDAEMVFELVAHSASFVFSLLATDRHTP